MQNYSKIPTESEMVKIFLKHIIATIHSGEILAKEVKQRQKKIDLVYIPKKSKSCYGPAHAIEFKVRNWRQCFKQSMRNRILMPLNSIAIWKGYSERIDLQELREEGIGLIEVSYKRNLTLLKPKISPFIDKKIYQQIKTRLING